MKVTFAALMQIKSRFLVKRDQGVLGSGGSITFYIEGTPVAKFGAGQGAHIYLKPGRYLFGVRPSISLNLTALEEIEADVNEHSRQVYRIITETTAIHIARTSE